MVPGLTRGVDMTVLCVCGNRRGLHRHGDEVCPNGSWLKTPGCGKPQWLEGYRFTARDSSPWSAAKREAAGFSV
jgi:hypothetical protein